MKRKLIIEKINSILDEVGSFSTSELQEPYSPTYSSIGKHHYQTIERIDIDNCEVFEYVHEQEVSSMEVNYSDLSKPLLKEILKLAETYVKENQ